MASNITANTTHPANSQIILRKGTGGTPLSHDEVDGNFITLMDGHNDVVTALGTKAASSHTHSSATASSAGFMSTSDKSKLDGISSSANNYSLPNATSSALGGVKVGTGISVSSGTISVANATTSANGLMSSTDKSKLNGIESSANNYSLPTASSSTKGGIKVGSGLSISNGVLSANTQSGTYSLPTASSGTLGGVKIGNGISISSGVISVKSNDSAINVASTGLTLDKATTGGFGVVKIGSGINVSSGVISVSHSSYTLPTASASTLGGVKVGTGLSISNGILSASGAGVSIEGVNTGFGRSLAISGGESGSPDAGAIELAGASRNVASGDLYVVNPEEILRVYINQSSGVDIGSGYGTGGYAGGGIPGFRGVIRDNHDSRARAIPVGFKNFGQAEKYINFYHPSCKTVQFFIETDVTETLYSSHAGNSNNAVTRLHPEEHRNFEFYGVKGSIANPSIPKWTITFGNQRHWLTDSHGNTKIQGIQFDIKTPLAGGTLDWLCCTRGGMIVLSSYVGVKMATNFSYAVWRAGEGGIIYDFSFGDFIKASDNEYVTYHYEASLGSQVYQTPAASLGHGGLAYIMDGNFGVSKIYQDSTFHIDAYQVPHTGSDDPALSDLTWPDGTPVSDTTFNFGSGAEEVHYAVGPYTVYTGSSPSKHYEPVTETNKVPAFLFQGLGGSVQYAVGGYGSGADVDPIPYNRFRYSQVVGNVDWGYAMGNIGTAHGGTVGSFFQGALQWDPESFGFNADQATLINFGNHISRPIRKEFISTVGAKFRDFAYRKEGHQHGGPGFGGSTHNPNFTTSTTFHANTNANITNWA